jgi:hypothetical protein
MKDVPVVHNASGLNETLRVPVSVTSFTGFDAERFINIPYTSPWENGMGREFFWEYLSKTALFGEFSYPVTFSQMLAIFMNVFFIGLVLFAAGGAGILLSRRDVAGSIPLVLYSLLSVFLLVALRIKHPFAPSNDFRYIFPVLIPFGYYYGRIIQAAYEKKAVGFVILGVFMACGISVASILFILSPLI